VVPLWDTSWISAFCSRLWSCSAPLFRDLLEEKRESWQGWSSRDSALLLPWSHGPAWICRVFRARGYLER